jgi:phosphoribosylformimino-5-aminoimidazole carboxamide ribotide isomerase
MDGRCVRLTKGDFDSSIVYSDDPVEMARTFEDAGIGWLHLVDLDGARTGSSRHLGVLKSIKKATRLHVDFGGGLRDEPAIAAALDAGADQVTVGSAAIRHPDRFRGWLVKYGSERIILAADVKDDFVAVSGWTEKSSTRLSDLISDFQQSGLRYVMVTDVSVDGTLEGPAVDLYKGLKSSFPDLFLIASGGVGTTKDLDSLRKTGCDAAIVGKAFYEGRITLAELTQ